MKTIIYPFLLIILGALSCNVPTQQERRIIHSLNEKYPEYHFSSGDDYLGLRLKVNLTNSKWDSLALKVTYDSTIGIYKGADGIPWVYLSVYDKSDNYLFTMSKDNANGKHNFFRE